MLNPLTIINMAGNIFQSINFRKPKRFKYNLSHEVKASMKIGNLYPVLSLDVIPGDKFNVNTQHVCKLQPMLAPVMHSIDVKMDYFYVPYRLISPNFNEYVLGTDPLAVPPYVTTQDVFQYLFEHYEENRWFPIFRNFMVGSTWDFLGYPTPQTSSEPADINDLESVTEWFNEHWKPLMNSVQLNALPLIAMREIWRNYYKWYEEGEGHFWYDDPEYPAESGKNPNVEAQENQDPADDYLPRNISKFIVYRQTRNIRANWGRDYFTSALTQPLDGSDVTLSVGDIAPLVTTNANPWQENSVVRYADPNAAGGAGAGTTQSPLGAYSTGSDKRTLLGTTDATQRNVNNAATQIDVTSHTATDLSKATAVDVETLRHAFRLQKIKQLLNVAGTRIQDRLKAIWGVNSSDARLQLPEYLGGGRSPLVVSSVVQQAQSSAEDPLGRQGGQGLSVGKASAFNRYFEEHGIVIGIMRIIPHTAYMQGVSRDLLRMAKEDYAMPQFSDLGEQEVFNCELYFGRDDAAKKPLGTFGYQSRYADYKYKPDRVHGEFKTSLSYWHMARKFSEVPSLTSEFQHVDSTSVQSSVFTNPSEDTVYVDMYHRIEAYRPLQPNLM